MESGNWIVLAAVFALICGVRAAAAQQAQSESKVVVKPQAGTDSARVPASSDAMVRRMLELAKLGPKDYVVDLGSGDARTVIVAARDFGARAMGVASETAAVESLRKAALAAGVTARAQFRRADLFATDFATDLSSATVVTMSLLPHLNLRLRPQILDLRPGTRVLSYSSKMGDWGPDQEIQVEGHHIYMWTVPAKVGGNWTLQQPDGQIELILTQNFQKLQAKVRAAGTESPAHDERIQGDQISFVIVNPDGSRREYAGRVSGRQMQGSITAPGGAGSSWSAAKK